MTSRLEKRLESCLAAKEYYEAHQIYRTLYYRMKTAKKFDELMDLLFSGSCSLLQANEFQSGADLSDLFVDVLITSMTSPSDAVLSRIETLLKQQLIAEKNSNDENDTKRFSQARNKFITDCIKWSQMHGIKIREKKRGLSVLHQKIGQLLWNYEDYDGARNHLLVAENAELFADFLVKIQQKFGEPNEHDLFIALAVLQLLCLKRAKTAWSVFNLYVKNHPVNYGELPCEFPLINFLWLLLLAIPKRKTIEFCELVQKYEPSIDRDPAYKGLLDKIGQTFFNLPAPNHMGGGLFGNLFKGLLGVEKKSEDDGFTASDVEFEDTDVVMADEEGYTTADEEEDAHPTPSQSKSGNIVDQMDDLD